MAATTQISVRLPEDLVAFVDEVGPTRAAVIARALAREKREHAAARDAEIYAGATNDDQMEALAAYASRTPLDID